MVWTLMLWACDGKDPSTGTDLGSPDADTDTDADADTDADTDTDTATTPSETGDTGEGPVTDVFLSGDPASLIAVIELTWNPTSEPTRWGVIGLTFAEGTFTWTGSLDRVATGPDTCEVRSGDPELTPQLQNFGAIDLFSGGDHVFTSSVAPGAYFGQELVAEIDPRGRTWDVMVEGSAVPGFQLLQAIRFPTDDLALTAPADNATFDRTDPLAVRWSGAAAQTVELALLADDGSVRVRCAMADDGAFDVDPAVLAALPAGRVSFGLYRRNLAGPAVGPTGAWVQLYGTIAREGAINVQ
ncbi:MAG: hypothetical protein ABMB14_10850 [Myxococcota bacterium]